MNDIVFSFRLGGSFLVSRTASHEAEEWYAVYKYYFHGFDDIGFVKQTIAY